MLPSETTSLCAYLINIHVQYRTDLVATVVVHNLPLTRVPCLVPLLRAFDPLYRTFLILTRTVITDVCTCWWCNVARLVCDGSMTARIACFVSRAKERHINELFHTGALGSPGVSSASESSAGVNVGSDIEAILALGTSNSNSNDELECFRPRRMVVHKDITLCVVALRIRTNSHKTTYLS